jgi:hypothetical protein
MIRATKRTISLVYYDQPQGKDYDEIAKKEKLKPIEIELRKMEDAVTKIKDDLSYMKSREMIHRDTSGN